MSKEVSKAGEHDRFQERTWKTFLEGSSASRRSERRRLGRRRTERRGLRIGKTISSSDGMTRSEDVVAVPSYPLEKGRRIETYEVHYETESRNAVVVQNKTKNIIRGRREKISYC